jgi:UDP-3-O-[3-hydroxymyristoyl] glucosamine N-acyltransferase
MHHSIADIAKSIGARFAGDGTLTVSRIAEPAAASVTDLALAMTKVYAADLHKGSAEVAVLWEGADWTAYGLKAAILVTRPRLAMAGITAMFEIAPAAVSGIAATAEIDATALIGKGASVGAFCVIGAQVKIGDNAKILPHVTIGENTTIGADCLLYSGVRIGSRVRIGDRFIAHYNAVIGSDGFSFVTPETGAIEAAKSSHTSTLSAKPQPYSRIASIGSVEIGDDVEIGALSSVDKGTVADTRIGRGTKIDNHVQIGHNVQIGQDCLLCAHSAVAGSSILGDRVVLGGQAGVADHIKLGDGVIAGGASAILSNVPAGRVVMGYPAVKMDQNIETYKALRRLPRLMAKVEYLQKLVSNLNKTG